MSGMADLPPAASPPRHRATQSVTESDFLMAGRSPSINGSPRDAVFGDRLAPRKEGTNVSVASIEPPSLTSDNAPFPSPHPSTCEHCGSGRAIHSGLLSLMSLLIVAMATFATLMSGAYVVVAFLAPKYGKVISTSGRLTPSTAAFLTSFVAKFIEVSYVTVIVALIGQVLARRAFRHNNRGITLAELGMRNWVIQPGTMFTQWESVKYAGGSILGVVAIAGAMLAWLYTSAATALVQPQLKWPTPHGQVLFGAVRTQFANPSYINSNCKTPITSLYDPTGSGSTCITLYHSAEGYHNYYGFLATWADTANNGTGSSDLATRPQGYAVFNDSTTVTAPWIEHTNVTELHQTYGYIINNVSMAMPHPGVVQAATDRGNGIMQPSDLFGLGGFSVRASVPSPVLHSLCVTLTAEQLKPLVYELWDDVAKPVNMTLWPEQLAYSDPYLGGTPLDDIFQWGPKYGSQKYPPVFGKLPIDFNTIINGTLALNNSRDAIYMLGKGGPIDAYGNNVATQNYALCQLKVSQTPACSTTYNATNSGGSLVANCEDPNDELAYIKSVPNAASGNATTSLGWPDIASQWSESLALNDGLFDSNGSNARLLTQLILTQPYLNPTLPSAAEALAVMACCTILQSATDAPFVELWNHATSTVLSTPIYQPFNASVQSQQYASGGTQRYQKLFFVVLLGVFLLNVLALTYFVTHREWYNDFTEPVNLFSLAVSSPPSQEMREACGAPGSQFQMGWKLSRDSDHVYLETLDPTARREAMVQRSPTKRWSQWREGQQMG